MQRYIVSTQVPNTNALKGTSRPKSSGLGRWEILARLDQRRAFGCRLETLRVPCGLVGTTLPQGQPRGSKGGSEGHGFGIFMVCFLCFNPIERFDLVQSWDRWLNQPYLQYMLQCLFQSTVLAPHLYLIIYKYYCLYNIQSNSHRTASKYLASC